jgi:TonB family protein
MTFRCPLLFLAVAGGLLTHAPARVETKPAPAAQEEPYNMPDLQVVADSLKDVRLPTKEELAPAAFSDDNTFMHVAFPGRAAYEGVPEGNATVGVMLDREGKPVDFLLLRYTEVFFGEALLEQARHQQYAPRRLLGVAVPGTFNFTYYFRPLGNVSNFSSFDAGKERNRKVGGNQRYSYEPHREADLDHGQLEPTRVAIPVLPPALVEREGKAPKVLVSFYVDEQGRVRLPNVESVAAAELVTGALAAVQQWAFKPPAIKSHGVLVYAMRVLTFRTDQPTPAASAPKQN